VSLTFRSAPYELKSPSGRVEQEGEPQIPTPPPPRERLGGGGGNRKHRISSRFAQLRVITGDRIPSYRKQKTAKGTFGKPFCQVAKSNAKPCREGRTWETYPPPRPWGGWRARSCRVLGMQSREIWRAPSCGYWHVQRSNRDGSHFVDDLGPSDESSQINGRRFRSPRTLAHGVISWRAAPRAVMPERFDFCNDESGSEFRTLSRGADRQRQTAFRSSGKSR
jgi:hypothetical protein